MIYDSNPLKYLISISLSINMDFLLVKKLDSQYLPRIILSERFLRFYSWNFLPDLINQTLWEQRMFQTKSRVILPIKLDLIEKIWNVYVDKKPEKKCPDICVGFGKYQRDSTKLNNEKRWCTSNKNFLVLIFSLKLENYFNDKFSIN